MSCACHSSDPVDRLFDDYMNDPLKVEEADSWIEGTLDGDHYSEVERTLADLHLVHPSDLSGSDVLVRLYRLAKVHGMAREAKLMEMAEEAIDLDYAQSPSPSDQFMDALESTTGYQGTDK